MLRNSVLIAISLALISSLCLANEELDSLLSVFHDATKPDTDRLIAIDKSIWKVISNDPDSATSLGRQQLALAIDKGEKKWQGIANIKLGIACYYRRELDEALEYYLAGLEVLEPLDESKQMGNAYNNIALCYVQKGEYEKALDYDFKLVKLRESIDDTSGLTTVLLNIGIIYKKQFNYPLALEYILKSLKLAEKISRTKTIASCNQSLGRIFFLEGDLKKAIKYANMALKAYEEIGNKRRISQSHSNIGSIYKELGQIDKAFEHFKKAVVLSFEVKNNVDAGANYNEIGYLHYMEDRLDTALSYYSKAIEIFKEKNYELGLSDSYIGMGLVYLKTKNYSEARKYCEQSYELAVEVGSADDDCKCLSDAYSGLGHHAKSLEYYKLYVEINDSIKNEEKTREITRLEMQYGFDKKQAELEIEQARKDAQQEVSIQRQKLIRNTSFAGGGLLLILAFVLFEGAPDPSRFLPFKSIFQGICDQFISDQSKRNSPVDIQFYRFKVQF